MTAKQASSRSHNHTAIFLVIIMLCAIALIANAKGTSEGKGTGVENTAELSFTDYKGSYALLIGVSKYQNWADLPEVLPELDLVSESLTRIGFDHVHLVRDPNEDEMRTAIERFIDDYGFDENNRLLIFFSGHGHSRGSKGYLVPKDAANPTINEKAFLQKAIGMEEVMTWARKIESRHVLFLFDSCFSGSIFKTKSSIDVPAVIENYMAKPVRQFITAGSAMEEVPAKSVFVPVLLKGINNGKADLNFDGYITGSELGMYITNEVPTYQHGTTPQYGKIRDSELDEGDFLFALNGQNMRNLTAKELARWQMIRDCKSLAELKDFVRDFPDGTFTAVAQQCIKDIEVNSEQPLYVDTFPRNATVRVLNIGSQYHYGIKLNPGRYQLEVSQQGYETQTSWFNLSAQNRQLTVTLKEKPKHQDVTYQVKGVSFTLKAIPGGSFEMGSNNGEVDEKPVHRVSIKPFKLMEHEVTWAMYQPCIDAGACPDNSDDEGWGKGNRPMINVSWSDINQFYIPWLNSQTGQNFRLPSEAEWEYAARAGSTTNYSWGNLIGYNKANCWGCGSRWDDSKSAPVKSFSSNAFGLYDMHGNVWEWVQDCYNDRYHGAPDDGSVWVSGDCDSGVLRGGSWSSKPSWLRSASRLRSFRSYRDDVDGFRLAQD